MTVKLSRPPAFSKIPSLNHCPSSSSRFPTSFSFSCWLSRRISCQKMSCSHEDTPQTLQTITISYSELKDKDLDLSTKIEDGFGPNGLGILSVSEYLLVKQVGNTNKFEEKNEHSKQRALYFQVDQSIVFPSGLIDKFELRLNQSAHLDEKAVVEAIVEGNKLGWVNGLKLNIKFNYLRQFKYKFPFPKNN